MEAALSADDVILCGYGAVTALGTGTGPLHRGLANNTSGLARQTALDGKGYQSAVAGLVPHSSWTKLASGPGPLPDRACLLAGAALSEARDHSRAFLKSVPAARRGLVLSTTKANIEALEAVANGAPCADDALRHLNGGALAFTLARDIEAGGPVQCVSTACVSGLLALARAASLILDDKADVVHVAGVDIVSHFVLAGFSTLKALARDGCRPFDRARDGLSLGEGAGAIILARRAVVSRQGPLIRIRGWGSSNDANHLTGPSRDGSGLRLAIERALSRSNLRPSQVDYAHLHGTGTPYNDDMESAALRGVFGDATPPCGSSKGMLGHTLGAAGILETILCALAIENRLQPGTPRLLEADPAAPSSMLANPAHCQTLKRVLKINSGFGGTNAALILEEVE